jgi:hemoglobin
MTEVETEQVEVAIVTMVREFYGRARLDPMLGPIFNSTVVNWEKHFHTISNFWSKVLLKTNRYNGHAYVHHVNLPIEPAHIEHWLALFAQTVETTLPDEYRAPALAKARMMGDSFKAGMFPFVDKDGKPSRNPV